MSEEEKKTEEKKPEEKKTEPKDNLVETKHSLVIGGKEIKYTVTAGTMVMKEETPDREKESEGEKPKAAFFFVAYTKDDVAGQNQTPTDLFLQRRTRFFIGLAAPRSARSAAGGHG